MKTKKYLKSIAMLFLLIFFLSVDTKAQSKFHVDLDYHYYLGMVKKIGSKTETRSDYNMGGNSLTLAARYDVHPKISVGAGIGLARYTQGDNNTLPIYATLRYKPIETIKNAYVFTDLGYAIDDSKNDFTPGTLFNLGVGYTKMFAKHFGVNVQLGYNFKQFKYTKSNIPDLKSTRHSVIFGLGLTF